MKKAVLVFFLVLVTLAFHKADEVHSTPGNAAPGDGVFVHMTRDHADPHRVLMPLQMAMIMAEDKDVLLYLDIDAVKLVTKSAADVTYKDFMPLKASLKKLMELGVGIYACPGCMKAAGIEAADLISGVKVAEKDRFFDFTEGRIITLNY
jgi:predicted peroxiredoxin